MGACLSLQSYKPCDCHNENLQVHFPKNYVCHVIHRSAFFIDPDTMISRACLITVEVSVQHNASSVQKQKGGA